MIINMEGTFWAKARIGADDECWPWQRATTRFGHGWVGIDGKQTTAHRIAWSLINGPIPDGLCVLHKCDNPPCVNPSHLFLGTRSDNHRDMMLKGRHRSVSGPGALNPRARLSELDVVTIRQRYKRGVMTQNMLAEEYGVSRSAIKDILSGKNWHNLPGAFHCMKIGKPSNKEMEGVSS